MARSLELAALLCEAILSDEIILKAEDALKLLKVGSPFALARIVELAERTLVKVHGGFMSQPVGGDTSSLPPRL
jgi:hypothetical protein